MSIYFQFIRYSFVGLASNVLLYLAYLLLTTQGLDPKPAMSMVYASGALLTFIANRSWSFRHGGRLHSAFIRYMAAYVLGYLLNLGLLWVAVDYMHLPHQGVQAVAIVLVALSLFLMHRYWVFAPTASRRSAI
jgi:putative flippase GtrA